MTLRRKSTRSAGQVAFTPGPCRPLDAGAQGVLPRGTPKKWPPHVLCLTANPKHDTDTTKAREDKANGHWVTMLQVPKSATSYKHPQNPMATTDAGGTTISFPICLPPSPVNIGINDTSPPPLTTTPL
ncbi:hypothetical protein BDZ97DRAFT_1923106 [Flammula alnicola]|nr:hypothetical protein BDZ97DRAFT_1923106 [Flammula alnicola]